MAETGLVRFPGSLDPRAEEFTPTNQPLYRPAQLFYPYAPTSGVQLQPLPFCNAAPIGVPYPQFCPPAAYVGPLAPPASPSPSSSTSPTRSLLLSSVPAEVVSESMLRRELEVFGDVRGVQMERVREGIVTVHFYDLRHAETALMAIRRQHMQQQTRLRNFYSSALKSSNSALESDCYAPPLPPPARGLVGGRAVWAQYIVPPYNAVPQGQNQGTIVIFNLDSDVSAGTLRQTFEAFGPVRELRDTPSKKNQRFVEFFDVRDAAKALREMNGKQINGKAVVIEFSRPGGHGRKFFNPPAISKYAKPFNSQPPSPPPPPPFARKNARRFPPPPRAHHLPQPQLSSKELIAGNKGNDNANLESVIKSVSLETTMCLANLSGEEEKQQSEEPAVRNAAVKNCGGETVAGSTKQPQQPRNRNWKGKQGKKQETRFLIKEDATVESSCKDSRTTVMIKNIPNKYSQKLLLNMLDNHCIHCNEQISDADDDQPISSYDFVYLPIDFNNKCNVGYGFVNMTSPEATLRLYKAFHLQHWEVFNSRKICEVTYARVQGLEALKEHFKNSKFPCEVEHYLPVVFSPPRDGRQLTEPLPIVGQKQQGEAINDDGGEVEGENRGGGGGKQQDDMQSGGGGSENGGGMGSDDDADRRRDGEEVGRDLTNS
ncbi:protein terminal ear1 [Prosopis cineraria]|uniref:protein terminal ear1 n=1 Tax=Prosopis cineraria TaxID=364024 RepID=UPI00241055EF|nr:protein terminal ear1 [Prosopis cineraria]